MKIRYYDFAEATIPDERIKMVLEPPSLETEKGEIEFKNELKSLLEEKLVPRLSGISSLLLLVDDITRQTPTKWILPVVIDIATRCG
ncbi:MAG: hypothetical protein PWQ70_2843, partial [Clostridiales bacterium]|nr:hypothetical protein [Clostridiales bacterium]